MQIAEVAIFEALILFGGSRVGAWVLSKLRDNEQGYFITMLGILAVAGVLSNLIKVPGIVGAFLAGLSVNAAVGEHSAKEKLEFIGKAMFTPVFFIVTGFLIAPIAFEHAVWTHFWLVGGLIASLILGKGIAALLAGRTFGYSRQAKLEMVALTFPQVAATLAASLVGYKTFNAAGIRLLDAKMLNAVLVLLLVTSILGPLLTERFAPGLVKDETPTKAPEVSGSTPEPE